MGNVTFDIQYMLVDDFFTANREVTARTDKRLLSELLRMALCNKDVSSRVAIANKLLDWGADPSIVDSEKSNVLHVFACRLLDPVVEAPMLRRLLDRGADPNLQSPRYGMPLDAFMQINQFLEVELSPVYDVLFARPDLDFFKKDRFGDSLWDRVCKSGSNGVLLVERARQYIEARTGKPAPAPYYRKKQPDMTWFHFHMGDNLSQDAEGFWHLADGG